MMRSLVSRWGPLLGVLAGAACSSNGAEPSGKLRIESAPLRLDEVGSAIYTITVVNADGELVWQRSVDSTQYGNGGGIAYVGTCDASSSPNTVTLEIDALSDVFGNKLAADEWQNPGPVTQTAPCIANTDTPVTFDFTIMRSGHVGFFDVSVNFDDVFCSAKVDCQDELLFNPRTGQRDTTAVIALACSGGPGEETTLYWADVAIVCRDEDGTITHTYPLNPGAGPGQHGPVASSDGAHSGVYEVAIYRDEQEGGDMCSWNLAVGVDFDTLGTNCSVEGTATASGGALPGMHTPEGVYPVISYSVPLTGPKGESLCEANPLNGPDSGVTTTYTSGTQFDTGAACGGDVFTNALACGGVPDGAPAPSFAPAGDGKITVSYGSQTIGPFGLPPGITVDLAHGECCVELCCQETTP